LCWQPIVLSGRQLRQNLADSDPRSTAFVTAPEWFGFQAARFLAALSYARAKKPAIRAGFLREAIRGRLHGHPWPAECIKRDRCWHRGRERFSGIPHFE
jgi:hypothetical protein